MKDFLVSCVLHIAKGSMSFIYFFIKVFPIQKNKITMISRQSNSINIDFKMLLKELQGKHQNIKVKVLCKMVPSRIN